MKFKKNNPEHLCELLYAPVQGATGIFLKDLLIKPAAFSTPVDELPHQDFRLELYKPNYLI